MNFDPKKYLGQMVYIVMCTQDTKIGKAYSIVYGLCTGYGSTTAFGPNNFTFTVLHDNGTSTEVTHKNIFITVDAALIKLKEVIFAD